MEDGSSKLRSTLIYLLSFSLKTVVGHEEPGMSQLHDGNDKAAKATYDIRHACTQSGMKSQGECSAGLSSPKVREADRCRVHATGSCLS
jgi:hypothetical protein